MGAPATERAPAFRGDIQGMRAIAVLAVMAGHAGVSFLPGGFVGVDVFFVLSGYLITRLMLDGVRRDGGMSLPRFYARRARRILPAASVVLAVTVAASVVYLNFIDGLRATKDATWAALFAANINYARQGVDYFATDQSPSPLQHFWSLAVEEQFYVVWPLAVAFLVLVVRLLTRRRGGAAAYGVVGVAAVGIGAASLWWSVDLTARQPEAAYFSSLTRAWELAAGALLAVVLSNGRALTRRWLTEPLAVGGLVAIGIATVTYDEQMAFPGWAAVLPVAGTMAVVVAGAHPQRRPFTARLLGMRPLERTGDWSYSLYLWHWPLLIIPQVRLMRPLSPTETLIAVAVTFQLAYLTHRFVEQPFRRGRFWQPSWRGMALYPLSLAVVLPAIWGSHQRIDYLSEEHGDNPAISTVSEGVDGNTIIDQVRAAVLAAKRHRPIPSDLTPNLVDLSKSVADVGDCDYNSPGWHLCRRGDVASDKVVVVTGDSHARAWIPAMEKITQEAGYAAYYLVKPRCAAPFVEPAMQGTDQPWHECVRFHEWVTDQVARLHPDVMIVTTAPPWSGIFDADGELVTDRTAVADAMAHGFDDMFATYKPLVGQLELIVDAPRLTLDPGTCLAQPDASLSACTQAPASFTRQMQDVSVAAATRAGVPWADPTPWLCQDGVCPVVVGSTLTYRDPGHITTERAAQLWHPLGVELGLLPRPTPPSPSSSAGEQDDGARR